MPGTQPRNIVLLSDGTGNSSSSLFKTNVRRLYEALDLADPRNPRQPRQFAYYDDGVGTSSFRPLAILGGAFGYGLARNVRDLYAFLCRTYRPGDRIYAFGFSRGAFTVRVTIGLIANQGILVHDGDEATLARNVRAAWRAYRRERYGGPHLASLWRGVRDAALRGWWRAAGYTAFEDVTRRHIGEEGQGTIEFVGVWDTVDAYGLPIEELTRAVDAVLLPLTMPDARLSDKVKRARHAISLDDERNTFHPRLWTEDGETDPNRIRQVWFAGVHADVGGGYAEDGLAHVTLRWMMNEAEAAVHGDGRLRFLEEIRARQRVLADENAPLHDSRAGLASYYRYKPRRVSALASQPARWGRRVAVTLGTPIVHESVLRRIRVGQDGYAPISLPPDFRVQRVEGGAAEIVDGDAELWPPGTPGPLKQDFTARQEHVWNFVWWRRVAYFVTLGGTLFLVAMPLFMEVKACSSWACLLSPALLGMGVLLPGFVATWTQVFAANPATTLAGAAVVLAGTVLGRHLDVRIPDEMRRLWYRTALRPAARENTPAPRERGWVNTLVQRLRTAPTYEAVWEVARRIVIPTLAFFVAAALALAAANKAVLSAMESWEMVCGDPGLTTAEGPFHTSAVCHLVASKVEAGARYRLRVTIPAAEPWPENATPARCRPATAAARDTWWDCSMPATPNGILGGHEAWWMPLAVPFRRHLDAPWYALMARIGQNGSDVYAPDWRLVPDGVGTTYEAVLRARRSGPLYLYVNDAALAVDVGLFYRINNHGTADVEVRLLDREGPPR